MSVYVVEKPSDNKNISSALDYGKFEFILDSRSNMIYSPVPTVNRIRYKLQNFNDNDYLLLIGDPVAIGVCMHHALLSNTGRAKLLKWDNRDYKYNIIEVDINV